MVFSGTLATPLVFGHVIIISGAIKDDAERLEINFLADTNQYDIPLHMEVIFGADPKIMRTSKLNNLFGAKENNTGFSKELNPLKRGDII